MNISSILEYLYPDNEDGDWSLQDDGSGAYISAWTRSESMPSIDEMQKTSESDGFLEWKKIRENEIIDRRTGSIINAEIHRLSGVDETLGILSDQIVEFGYKLGLSFTEDFSRLNELAIAAIGKSQIEKEALDA